jgi:YVTN family beta-propeller protein
MCLFNTIGNDYGTACNRIITSYRRTNLEDILLERSKLKMNPQIELARDLGDMVGNSGLNKVYVTDLTDDSVFVIDSNSGNMTKKIHVGEFPVNIDVDTLSNKVYVANTGDNTVSIINGATDKKEVPDIRVGKGPIAIAAYEHPDKIISMADLDKKKSMWRTMLITQSLS